MGPKLSEAICCQRVDYYESSPTQKKKTEFPLLLYCYILHEFADSKNVLSIGNKMHHKIIYVPKLKEKLGKINARKHCNSKDIIPLGVFQIKIDRIFSFRVNSSAFTALMACNNEAQIMKRKCR